MNLVTDNATQLNGGASILQMVNDNTISSASLPGLNHDATRDILPNIPRGVTTYAGEEERSGLARYATQLSLGVNINLVNGDGGTGGNAKDSPMEKKAAEDLLN